MMKRIFAILLALAMLLSVTAVFAEAEEPAAEPETAVEMTPVPDTLLVTVSGREIRENNEKLQSYLSDVLPDDGNPDNDMLHIARMLSMSYMLQEQMLSEK